jgi:hypothetical protein
MGAGMHAWSRSCSSVMGPLHTGLIDFQLSGSCVQVPLALPRLRSAIAIGQPAFLQCELWLLAGKDSLHALSQANLSVLIGLCSIPLQFCAPQDGVIMLSQGCHTLPNVLEGWDGAQLEVRLTAAEHAAQELAEILPHCRRSQLKGSVALPAAVSSATHHGHLQEGTPPQMPPELIHHSFEVHMLSMNDLPAVTVPASTGAVESEPVARYLKCAAPSHHLCHTMMHVSSTKISAAVVQVLISM